MATYYSVWAFFMTLAFVLHFGYASLVVRNYSQVLNHFGYGGKYDNISFNQQIATYDDDWGGAQKKAPILVFFGGERLIAADIGQVGIITEAAPRLQALVLYIEHRFYGASIPYGSIGMALGSSEVRSFLTSEQALADFADIIVSLKANLSANDSPVIVLGYSYGGVLAAWFRLKYPHIAIGALASSAPILFWENIPSEKDFCSILSSAFEYVNQECAHHIRQSWDAIDELTSRVNGLGVLTKTFNLCRPLISSLELIKLLARTYTYAATSNGRDNFLINKICDVIVGTPVSDIGLEGIAAAVEIVYSENKGLCIDLNITGAALSDDPFYTAWDWQTCTEIIMHKSCAKNNSLLIPSEAIDDGNEHKEECLKKYGALPSPDQTPHFYTARDIRAVGSNIIFSNGRIDPYSSLGILDDMSDTILAVTTNEGSQALDMCIRQEDDPEWLKDQRNKEIQILKAWINGGVLSKSSKLLCHYNYTCIFGLLFILYIL